MINIAFALLYLLLLKKSNTEKELIETMQGWKGYKGGCEEGSVGEQTQHTTELLRFA